ncbi:MAG: DUF885 domain-containing protein [Flavobacteriales bacterium]|nr:DUF885 domain-containing protein [Flavobacteriales bacterium]
MEKLLIACLCLALFACDSKTKESEKKKEVPAQDFEQFKLDYIDAMWAMNPISASYQGLHKYDDQLPILNEERKQKGLDFSKEWLNKLNDFNYESLSELDKIDYHLMDDNLSSTDFYTNEFKGGEWNPSSYNLGGAFFQVINYQGNDLNDRLEALSKKLDKVQAYYQQAQQNIQKPTEVHVRLAVQQLEGSKSIFEKTLADSLAVSSKDDAFKEAFTVKLEVAVEAIDAYKNFLQIEFLDKSEDSTTFRSFRIGEDLFAKKSNSQIQSAYSAKEIFEAAVEEKEDLHEKLYRLSEMLWEKYHGDKEKPGGRFEQIQMVIDAVAKTHVHRDSFVTAIRQQIPELIAFVNDNDLIALDAKKPLVVRETPEYMRGFAGASISAPGPYDADAETYYNVTPLDHYSEEEAESYLREYNNFTLQILNIHEAIPGHYTQLVYSNQSPSLIKSILGNGAMIEGWAVYTEKMMLENGYGGDNIEMGLMYYKWNLRTVCNTILDYGVHVMNYTEEDAMQLLMKEAFQEKSEAEGKWRRARLSQVQLCSYFTGYYEIMQLRSEIQERLGEAFNLKSFHEEFLSYGSAPVKYIRKLMIGKLDQEGKPA